MKNDDKKNLPIGQVCNVDKLGRIVIPALMRKAYDLEENNAVELIMEKGYILMRKYQPGCVFCGNVQHLSIYKGKLVCSNCIEDLKK